MNTKQTNKQTQIWSWKQASIYKCHGRSDFVVKIVSSALSYFPSSYLTSVVGIQKTTLWILDVYFPRLQMFLIFELCFTDMRHKWYWFINVNIKEGVNFINFHVRVLLHAVLGCSRKGLLILKYSACQFTIELLLEELYEKWQGVT